MVKLTVAQAVAQELAQAGVDRVFGLPGGEVLFLIEALREQGIAFDLWRHEADAGLAAAVYGKLKGVPGVVLTTLGPGAANLMLPLTSSLLDREPLIAISAQIPASWPSSHTHQRLPLLEAYGPVTKFASELNRVNVRQTVRNALQMSIQEPAGPTYLTLSAEEATKPCLEVLSDRTDSRDRWLDADASRDAEEIRSQLQSAANPLVLVGAGISTAHAADLRSWLDLWNLPVAVTPKIKGIVDETAPNFVGVVSGMAIDNIMVEAIKSADLLVGFGFDPVEVDKQWHATCPMLSVIDAPLALGVIPHSNVIISEFASLLARLTELDAPRKWGDQFAETKSKRLAIYDEPMSDDSTLSEHPVRIVKALAETMPHETIVTTDVGSHKYIFGQFWPSRHPGTFFMSNGLSGMGYGLSSAVGAKLACPDTPVLAAVGDGGFSMNFQELETMVRLGTPVIIVVLADESYSLIQISQQNKKLTRYGVNFNPIDSIKVAEACGVKGVRVTTAGALISAVKEAMSENKSMVIEVPISVTGYQGIV